MRIEYDQEARAVYVALFEGVHARTVEVEPLRVYVDVDAEGRTLGVEFLSFGDFKRYMEEHGGLNLPERFAGPQSLVPA
jgi:uncharacterized protein YuzE